MSEFSIHGWAAWGPGLLEPVAWREWFARRLPHPSGTLPTLTAMPALLRRRVERLGRVALSTAYRVQEEPGAPLIFASRYGELARSAELLSQLARDEALSPTSFSLSVHNAIGALYSIARGDAGNYTAVAAGPETVEAAFVEALGLLADGADEVLIVAYEEPVPAPWTHFDPGSVDFPRAFCCRVRRPGDGVRFSLRTLAEPPAPETKPAPALPADLAVLQFLLDEETSRYEHRVGARHWCWERHA